MTRDRTEERARLPDQEKGRRNVSRVEEWINRTPLKKIPVNQFRMANVGKILNGAGVGKSARSNPRVKELIATLNQRLGADPNPTYDRAAPSEDVKALRNEINRLQNRLAALGAENSRLHRALEGEEFFLATGRVVRTP